MTFKSFMLSQNDDVPPEEFNRRYEQYSMQYVNDFSDAFFQETKHEEWFQERYNPLTIAEIEEDTAAWAVRESHKFKSSLSGKTAAAIKSMSLSPPPGFVTTRLGNYPKGGSGSGGGGGGGGAEQAAEATAGTASEEKAESDAGGEKAAEEAEASALSIDLKTEGSSDGAPAGEPSSSDASNEESEKHLAGHDRRTVYLYGIPPACDKETLREAICTILARDSVTSDERKKLGEGGVAGPMAPPERIMVAQPTWSGKHHKRFERAAWMVMSSPEAAKEAILRLRDAPIPVYEPSNPFTCEKVQQATFPLQTQMHVPRPQPPLPEKYSTAARVRSDFFKAVELAAQLDEDRGVPSNCRLQTLLDPEASPEIVSACEKATDKLDVSIAYLRRVHFVAFYAGSKFFDEAHLLAMSPCVIHRGYPYIPAPPRAAPGPPRLADGDGDGAEANDDTNGNKRKREDDDGEDDGEEGEDDDDDKEKEDIDAGEDEDNHDDDGDDDGKDEKNAVDNDKDAEVASDKPDEEDKGEADGEAAGGGAGAGEESIREEGQSVSASASASAREPTEEEKARQAHFAQLDRVRGAGRPPKQLTDRRIEDLIRDLKRKLGRRRAEARAAAEGKPLKGTIDEEDVKTIRELQQKTFDSLVVDHAKAEKEGKVRCWFANCNKLFKGIDFLRKHVKSKHTSFAWDRLLHDAEPFMRARFVAEDVRARPLPPMEMEIPGGVELKSILEILDKYAPPRYPGMSVDAPFGDMDRGGAGGPPRGRGPMGAHGMGMGMGGRGPMGGRVPFGRERRDRDIGGRDVGRDRNRGLGVDPHGRRSGGEGRGRGRDDRDRDRRHSAGPGSGSGSTFDRSAAKEYQQPTGEENSNRQISSYMDIDAPKVSYPNYL
jgi:hypothetical protein